MNAPSPAGRHIKLHSHPTGRKSASPIRWGAASAEQRGPDCRQRAAYQQCPPHRCGCRSAGSGESLHHDALQGTLAQLLEQ